MSEILSVEDIHSDREIWVPIDGTDGRYDISNHGRVRSYMQPGRWGNMLAEPMVLRNSPQGAGYEHVHINGKKRLIHSLVAEAFICSRPCGLVCDHIDDNRKNNVPANLRWVTRRFNLKRSNPKTTKRIGEPWKKVSDDDICTVLAMRSAGAKVTEIAHCFGVSRFCITNICNGKRKAARK